MSAAEGPPTSTGRAPPLARPGDAYQVMSDLIILRVTAEQSVGRLAVVEVRMPPGGGPPPLHAHPPDEVFHVLDGEITVYSGDPQACRCSVVNESETFHVRGDMPHTFRNLTVQPARLLLTFSPGEMMQAFFTRAGVPVSPYDPPALARPVEIKRVFDVGTQLGMKLFDPPVLDA